MKRPITVTIVGLTFIIAGGVGVYYHATELNQAIDKPDLIWIFILRLLAVIGGAFTLRGANWARWLLITWMAYHTVLSFFHTSLELAIHVSFLAIAAYSLFNSEASAFFRK